MDFLPQRTFTNFNYKNKNSKNKLNLPRIDTAYISYYDYERIRKNALVPKQEEILHNERIQKEQETTKLAKANALKEKIKNIHNTNNIYISNLNKYPENDLMLEAKKHLDKNEECVKQMEKLSLYAKVATIRERQLKEHEMMDDLYKRKEKKLDEMMELERLKELKQQQNRENSRKQLQREGCLTIIDQIKQKEYERIKQRDIIEKDRQMILRQIKEMQLEDIRQAEKKRITNENSAKEIVEFLFGKDTFDIIVGQREGLPTKPNPQGVFVALKEMGITPDEAIYFGDSNVDMQTAKNAKIKAVGVTWGFRSYDELCSESPDLIINNPSDITFFLN